MKRLILIMFVLISFVANMDAQKQTDVVGNRKYHLVAQVETSEVNTRGYPSSFYANLYLYEMYHLAYYTDNMGVRHDTWDFRGYYLLGPNDSYYKVEPNSIACTDGKWHVCQLKDKKVCFKYTF